MDISQVQTADLYVIVQKYQDPIHYKYVIINLQNMKKSDDLLYIKALRLPTGLSLNDMDVAKFI